MQDEIAKQPWESLFETVLGTDRDGAKYVYFPQFLKSDLRIYRHCLDNTILSTVKVLIAKERSFKYLFKTFTVCTVISAQKRKKKTSS